MDRPAAVTLYRCVRCGHAERAVEAPLHCGERMRALAVEMAPPKRRACCLGRRRGM